jgi:hypothetical protein
VEESEKTPFLADGKKKKAEKPISKNLSFSAAAG